MKYKFRLSLQNYFAKAFFVPNLFCEGPWSAKFILRRPLECKIYFAKALGVQNLFCEGLFRSILYFMQSGNAIIMINTDYVNFCSGQLDVEQINY
ncbi:MAG: hypothetical protein DRR16_17230 [Candidatus Parabeggiatoa sp. nov. 3]|nr:MAG: hypothetical protein DRR00_08290 [Gammaproteobacteria bacterium]RKZ67905.1 MAG: hypothetical protein DRQ99_05375 [Gammaproteobacteria bacterium]RKZ83460.1 MAG: hypothetical protein DRR16_17230 [Gammaproteobacteria bacterium]